MIDGTYDFDDPFVRLLPWPNGTFDIASLKNTECLLIIENDVAPAITVGNTIKRMVRPNNQF